MRSHRFICFLVPLLLLFAQLATIVHAVEHLVPTEPVSCFEGLINGDDADEHHESCAHYHISANLYAPATEASTPSIPELTDLSTHVEERSIAWLDPTDPCHARGPPGVC